MDTCLQPWVGLVQILSIYPFICYHLYNTYLLDSFEHFWRQIVSNKRMRKEGQGHHGALLQFLVFHSSRLLRAIRHRIDRTSTWLCTLAATYIFGHFAHTVRSWLVNLSKKTHTSSTVSSIFGAKSGRISACARKAKVTMDPCFNSSSFRSFWMAHICLSRRSFHNE